MRRESERELGCVYVLRLYRERERERERERKGRLLGRKSLLRKGVRKDKGTAQTKP